MVRKALYLVLGLAALWPVASPRPSLSAAAEPGRFVERYYALGAEMVAAGKLDRARGHFDRVLEREPRHLPTLHALWALEAGRGDVDEALWFAGRFLDTWRHLQTPPRDLRDNWRALRAFVKEADPLYTDSERLRRSHVSELLKLAERQMDKGEWHSARALLLEAVAVDPEHPELAGGLGRIRREGGNELAVEDEAGGADPLAGADPDWIAEQDPLHATWDNAWEEETEQYRIKTNAGYQALKTVALAMEQIHVFYREFHQYPSESQSVPKANVHIYKNSNEYKTLGGAPTDWAGGHWDGRSVVTYDHREGGQGSLRDTLQTLFHEASHQFTSLAGGPGVPAWLNEGMASFFEGTRLLSNGRVDWNLVAPGRLYPLVADLGGRNSLERVIQGEVDDYRVYYPWGWGIVYYLYNAEDEEGRLLYRHLMREYFQEYRPGDHRGRFTEFFIVRAKVDGVKDFASFEERFTAFIRRLEAEDKGKIDGARADEERADAALEREDFTRAVELYRRSLSRDPDRARVLMKLADALIGDDREDEAAGTLRQWISVQLLDGEPGDLNQLAEIEEVRRRIESLDPVARRHRRLAERFNERSLELAAQYRELGFPRAALQTLRGPATATPPSQPARELYFEIEEESGVSMETWRLLFNEEDLTGFYGGGERDFHVSDGTIRATIKPDEDNAPRTQRDGGRSFAFRRLFIDAEPAGDWSLSAEVRFGLNCRLAGLCFGKKEDGLFHGVGLLPEGYVDLARFTSDAETLLRTDLVQEGEWMTLQLAVTGTDLTASVDGREVLRRSFESRAELQGDFGLLAGEGDSSFREIRLKEFDRSLPRRTEAPDEKDGDGAPQRAEPGQTAYVGKLPPELSADEWVGAAPGNGELASLRGWPVLLVFWTTYQEKTLPLVQGIRDLSPRLTELGIPVLFISDEERGKIEEWANENGMDWPVASDTDRTCYEDYAIAKLGLPRAFLLDVDGKVFWEGNPDYHPDHGTYLSEPLEDLARRDQLAFLAAADVKVQEGEAHYQRGDLAQALEAWSPLLELDNAHPAVLAAKEGRERALVELQLSLVKAESLAEEGRFLQSAWHLERVATVERLPLAGGAAAELEELTKSKDYREANRLASRLASAERYLARGRADKAQAAIESVRERLVEDSDPWVAERCAWLLEELPRAEDTKALLERYLVLFPEVEDPLAAED